MISIRGVRAHPERWIDTTYLRSDGRIEYRERREFGNRHAVFEQGGEAGAVHHDRYNATDFPSGTVRHLSNYIEEKTGIPQDLTNILIAGAFVLGAAYAGHRIAKWAGEDA